MSRIKNLEGLTQAIRSSRSIDESLESYFNVLIQHRTIEPSIIETKKIIELRDALEERHVQTQIKISELGSFYFSLDQFRKIRNILPGQGNRVENPIDRAKSVIKMMFEEPLKDRIVLSAMKKESKLVQKMLTRVDTVYALDQEIT